MSQPSGVGGVRVSNTAQEVQDRLAASAAVAQSQGLTPGVPSMNVLHASGVVANGETVTIGTNVFEVDIINTDLAQNLSGALDGTTDPIIVTFTGAHGRAPGDLFRIENEIFKTVGVLSLTKVRAARARCATAKATHADALDVFVSDSAPAANIPVGLVTVLTAAAFTDALVAEINNALAGTERATAKASTIYGSILASGPTDAEVLIQERSPAGLALATTETGTNLAWLAATMFGGQAVGQKRVAAAVRVPTATEVTIGTLRVPLTFTPRVVEVRVVVTATGIEKGWVGGITIVGDSVVLDNAGATDWAVTDTIYLVAYE